MEGRGANLNKVRQQAASRNKAKVPTRAIKQSITTTPPITQEQPFIANAAMFMEPNETPSTISTPQELRKALTPMASVPIDRINTQQAEQEDPESERFLASLIAQGLTGLGAGLMGGSSQDILRSTGIFDRMRESDINRQDRLRQAELLRTERLGEKQERLAEIKKREDQAKSLTDPNSEESRKKREVYKSLGYQVPNNLSATDLNDPIVLQTLKGQMEQQKLAAIPRGGVEKKEEKQKERKLSQDERALLNNSALAYKALFDMEKAIKEGKSRSTIFGDNEYTYAANRFVEGIGRMQSGGAIGSEEVENFKRLIPGRFDSDELSKQKIKDMKAELESRLKSINYDPKEVLQSRTPSIDFKSEE